MSSEQVPLYLGIPLAVLCIAASAFVIAFIWWIVKDIWRAGKDRRP